VGRSPGLAVTPRPQGTLRFGRFVLFAFWVGLVKFGGVYEALLTDFDAHLLQRDWSVPAFMDTELGCQLTELPIP
jgi:hypothetical protein